MLKSIICLCVLAIVTANGFELNDSARQYLARIKMADLPESVQASLSINQGRGPSDASHWCCVNEQPITTVTATKVVHATHIAITKTKIGYMNCGFMGSMRCSQYISNTRVGMYTYIDTFQIPNMAACSQHEVKCCSGHLLVADNCHTITELVANQELFSFLAGLGLLTMPGVGK